MGVPRSNLLPDVKAQRRALKAQQKQLRRELKVQQRQQREALKAHPMYAQMQQQRLQRRRRRLLMALLLALLLLLLSKCECDEAPATPAPAPPAAPTVVKPPADTPPPPKKLRGRVRGTRRPTLPVQPPGPPSWLDAFRLQVAARSTLLAGCFNGIEKPGALRWSVRVHAPTGKVSASTLEPVLSNADITPKQVECLEQHLSSPAYKLDEPDPKAEARRVTLVFEF